MKYKVEVKVEAIVTYEVNALDETEAIEAARENLQCDYKEEEFVTNKVRPAYPHALSIKVLD